MDFDTTPPDRIPDSVSPKKAVEGEKLISQPPSTFESYMQNASGGPAPTAPGTAPAPQGATPMDLTKPTAMPPPGATPTMNSLMAQTNTIQDTLGDVGNQLNSPKLKLKRSQEYLLKNKLQDASGYLRAAGANLGIENPAMKTPSGASPAVRFLALLGDGQDQLVAVQKKLKELSASPGGLAPGDMMYLQIKMSQAQQEIEYSSTLLGKVIQSFTQLLQTQL